MITKHIANAIEIKKSNQYHKAIEQQLHKNSSVCATAGSYRYIKSTCRVNLVRKC